MPAALRPWAAILLALCLIGSAMAQTPWLDGQDRPSAGARQALQLLADAAADGLSPADYGADDLARQASTLPSADPQRFARELEAATLRYLHDLRQGRIDPHALGFRVPARADIADLAAAVREAAADARLPALAAGQRPRLAQYARLREALARYRALALATAPVTLAPATKVRPGEDYRDAAALRQRLVELGDLPADAPAGADRYDPDWAEGLRRFQRRHGLEADGVIGRATTAALNVPLAQRAEQLELALERLRWLPDFDGRPTLAINIPMFRLWAWRPAEPQSPPLTMGVVVGRALDTQTPVLFAQMRQVIFRPYWYVPRSILRKELLPALARDPAYLQRNDMEIVPGPGEMRVRQRPGPKNALGRVKFVFPNDDDIYLHDTPATQLFGRARRDFSHGCVRVEDPMALADWVLRDTPGWTPERIRQAAQATAASQRVDLPQPLPVLLFYLTAMVVPEDGSVHFADDIYGHDRRLSEALARRARQARISAK